MPDTVVAEAARLMLQYRISGLPVVDTDGTVVGMVTEGDLLRRAETGTQQRHPRWLEFLTSPGRLARDYTDAHARKVGEVMTTDVVSAVPKDPLDHVVRLMERHGIKRVPIVDDGRLVGIVSRANLVRALVLAMAKPMPHGAVSDAEISHQILDEISRQPWGPRESVDIRVNNGMVELYGTITDERERSALLAGGSRGLGLSAIIWSASSRYPVW